MHIQIETQCKILMHFFLTADTHMRPRPPILSTIMIIIIIFYWSTKCT